MAHRSFTGRSWDRERHRWDSNVIAEGLLLLLNFDGGGLYDRIDRWLCLQINQRM